MVHRALSGLDGRQPVRPNWLDRRKLPRYPISLATWRHLAHVNSPPQHRPDRRRPQAPDVIKHVTMPERPHHKPW